MVWDWELSLYYRLLLFSCCYIHCVCIYMHSSAHDVVKVQVSIVLKRYQILKLLLHIHSPVTVTAFTLLTFTNRIHYRSGKYCYTIK